MTVRFAVLAHDDAEMLRRLCLKLQPFSVWVHLDKSVPMGRYLASANGPMPSNVVFVSRRYSVNWGGFSVVQAMKSCASAAIQHAEPVDYVVFLSGRCYPIRPVIELEELLSKSAGQQFVRVYRLDSQTSSWHVDRYARRHWFDLPFPRGTRKIVKRLTRYTMKKLTIWPPPRRTNLKVVAGSQWMALTADCVRDALSALETREYAVFRNAFAPDEMAIQTFVYNSKWASSVSSGGPETLPGEDISSLPNFHYLRPALEGLATEDDFYAAKLSGAFFLRKIDSSSSVLEVIDASLRSSTVD